MGGQRKKERGRTEEVDWRAKERRLPSGASFLQNSHTVV